MGDLLGQEMGRRFLPEVGEGMERGSHSSNPTHPITIPMKNSTVNDKADTITSKKKDLTLGTVTSPQER